MSSVTKRGSGATTIKVIDHAVLFKLKEDYTQEQENNIYKGLWSFKDRFRTIMAMSVGRVLTENEDAVTHVLVMRFASPEALDTYLADDYRVEISYQHIVPFFNGELTADYETEVDSDLAELYREGEKYDSGVEHIELFKFRDDTPSTETEEFLNALSELPKKAGVNIVQLTAGTNYKEKQKYTHVFNARMASDEDLAALMEEPAYVDLLEKISPFLDGHLKVNFQVDESKKKLAEEFPRWFN